MGYGIASDNRAAERPLGIVTENSATFPEQRFCWIPLTTVFIMQLRGGPTQEGRPWTCVNNC